jgi:LacI family transcriptional regulator
MPKVTIKDVAKSANVSVGTASMALNGKKAVNSLTKKKVQDAAKDLGYFPNKYARLLNSKRTNVIGLIITDITNPFFGVIIDLIQEELASKKYDIMLGITKGSISKEQHFINKFIEMQVDGVIIVPSHKQAPNTAHLQNLRTRDIPICFITAYYTDVMAPCVMTDLSEGSYQLTKYLLEQGHKRIVYIVANRAIPVSNLRVEGYLRAYREAGLPFSPDWVVISEPTFRGGYDSTNVILQSGHPDAILAMNDIMAMGVLKHLKECCLRVPEDISVAGYDDLLYASLLETTLTTVQQPMQQMCKKAVEIILDKIEHPDEICEKVLLRPLLVIRSSTMSLRRASPAVS